MCKLGDIIVVNSYKREDGKEIGKHSFIVIDDESGTIAGLEYSFVASVISSFKFNNKKSKISYKENFELPINAIKNKELRKPSYVKADQAYYFNKEKLDYYVLGSLNDEYLFNLLKLILSLSFEGKLKILTENLIEL